MPITSPYANTCTETQDAAGRGFGHPSRIIPSHIMTVLKEKGSVEPVIFYSLSENGGKYHYIQILNIFFKERRNFCVLMPIRMYLRHLHWWQKAISLFAKFKAWVPDVLGIESSLLGLSGAVWKELENTPPDNARAETPGGTAGKSCCIQMPLALLRFLFLLPLDFCVESRPGCSSNARQTAMQHLVS